MLSNDQISHVIGTFCVQNAGFENAECTVLVKHAHLLEINFSAVKMIIEPIRNVQEAIQLSIKAGSVWLGSPIPRSVDPDFN